MGRVAFVMSGGGAKGSFELGALDYLIRTKELDPAVLVGVSTGNLNASVLAGGKGKWGLLNKLDTLTNLWFGLDENDDIYYQRVGGLLGLVFKADSIYSNKPLWKLIKQNVKPAELKSSGRTLRIGVVGLMSGDYFIVDGSYRNILQMIRASAAIPVAFNPVDIQEGGRMERWVDGGVRNVTPLNAAFRALLEKAKAAPQAGAGSKPDTIYVILASPLKIAKITDEDELDSGIEIGLRSLDMLLNEVYFNDLQMAATINESLKYIEKARKVCSNLPPDYPFAKYRHVQLVVIQPPKVLMGSLEFDNAKIKTAFKAGQKAAKKACEAADQMGGSNITPSTYSREIKVLRR